MGDLIVDSEEYFAAREAADLLARVREGCRVEHPVRVDSDADASDINSLLVEGPPELLRELADFLTHETNEEQDNGNV